MEKNLICINCGRERQVGRRTCRSCYLIARRDYSRKRYKTQGRHWYSITCKACNNVWDKAFRKQQLLCPKCYKLQRELAAKSISTNNYLYDKRGKLQHRLIAEQVLGRKLKTNEVIHHIDDNPKNNDLTNLVILDRRSHGKLHHYLDLQRVIIEKSINENPENCWNILTLPMTTAWLETTGVKVIKLWEIGQPAAEPLKPNSNEEGSETKPPKRCSTGLP